MGERIVIIGNAGGGKSRLADGLARKRGLPLHRLDRLLWNPGWVPTPEAAFRRRHDALAGEAGWIIDGVASWESIVHRIERCDTIVYVDLPIWLHYWWAAKRQLRCLFRPRPDFVPGCPMIPVTGRLIRMMWWLHRDLRPRLAALIDRHRADKHLYVLRSRREVDRFYERFCT